MPSFRPLECTCGMATSKTSSLVCMTIWYDHDSWYNSQCDHMTCRASPKGGVPGTPDLFSSPKLLWCGYWNVFDVLIPLAPPPYPPPFLPAWEETLMSCGHTACGIIHNVVTCGIIHNVVTWIVAFITWSHEIFKKILLMWSSQLHSHSLQGSWYHVGIALGQLAVSQMHPSL